MISVGLDAGSRAIKIVVYDSARDAVVAAGCIDQGIEQERLAGELLARLWTEAGLNGEMPGISSASAPVVATGYGRGRAAFAERTITEITCHARGVRRVAPEARTIVEIGGQDSKLILLDERGGVQDFSMNDRCAAGTGCFLEVVARRLEVDLGRLGELAAASAEPAAISSMCVVFAETEIIGLLATGRSPADIAAGVQQSIARRVTALLGKRLQPPVVFTGGVALVPGMREALSERLNSQVTIAADPQMTGALGAALLAANV